MADKRLSFDGDAEGYERSRPTYCRELFDTVIGYAGLGPGMLAVEVGPGTGQATGPVLNAGCRVVAVEYGANMADFLARKFADNPRFEVRNHLFEEFECAPGTVDALYSATAFHWIAEDVGYPKAYDMLRSGGAIALFWNRPGPPVAYGAEALRPRSEDTAMHAAFQAAYARHRGESIPPLTAEQVARRSQGILDTIRRYGFVDVECRMFYGERRLTVAQHEALLSTYSDHLLMPPEARRALYDDIAQAIDDHGGVMRIIDTMDLYLGRKP